MASAVINATGHSVGGSGRSGGNTSRTSGSSSSGSVVYSPTGNVSSNLSANNMPNSYNMNMAHSSRQQYESDIDKIYNYNNLMYNSALNWSEKMSNTAIQRQVQDLIKAGLNPVLATRLGGASYSLPNAPYLGMPQYQNMPQYDSSISRQNSINETNLSMNDSRIGAQYILNHENITSRENINELQLSMEEYLRGKITQKDWLNIVSNIGQTAIYGWLLTHGRDKGGTGTTGSSFPTKANSRPYDYYEKQFLERAKRGMINSTIAISQNSLDFINVVKQTANNIASKVNDIPSALKPFIPIALTTLGALVTSPVPVG